MKFKGKIYLIEDNNLTAFNTIEELEMSKINVEYAANFDGVLESYKDEKNNDICLVCDLNLPFDGSNFTDEEKDRTFKGKYSGWVWIYKNFLSKETIDEKLKKVIIYSAFIIGLENDYFENKDKDSKLKLEYKAYNKYITAVDKNEGVNSFKTLVKEIEKI